MHPHTSIYHTWMRMRKLKSNAIHGSNIKFYKRICLFQISICCELKSISFALHTLMHIRDFSLKITFGALGH